MSSLPSLVIDPSVFGADAVTPDTQAFNDKIEAALQTLPSIMEIGAAETRARRRAGEGLLKHQPPHPRASWVTASANGIDVPVRLVAPEGEARGALLHIHGGGWCVGAADAQDQTLAELADTLGVVVASVEYRLAPEHPYPAGPDDCEAAALWLLETYGGPLLISGESAGAHLAATTMLRLRDKHGKTPFVAASLVFGMFDMNGTPSVHGWGARNLVVNTPIIYWFADKFLPDKPLGDDARREPDVSPLYADLSGLCPALFTCGTLDPLLDDSILMATRWSAAGNAAVLDLCPGGIHGFTLVPDQVQIGREANDRAISFLRNHL